MVEDNKVGYRAKNNLFCNFQMFLYLMHFKKRHVQKSSLILAIQMLAVKCPVMHEAFVKFSDPGFFLLLIPQTL